MFETFGRSILQLGFNYNFMDNTVKLDESLWRTLAGLRCESLFLGKSCMQSLKGIIMHDFLKTILEDPSHIHHSKLYVGKLKTHF